MSTMDLQVKKKVNRPLNNGTAGQLLSTNGDGSTSWVSVGQPTDAQTAQAVSDWLDDHPEATTTVEDGSITKQKLNSNVVNELEGKAEAIYNSTGLKNTFSKSELAGYGNYIIECNADGYDTVYTVQSEDVCPNTDALTSTDGIFTKQAGKNTCHIEGSPTANKNIYLKVNNSAAIVPKEAISQDDVVRLEVYVDGSITATSGGTEPGRMSIELKYTDNTTASFLVNYTLAGGVFTNTITASKDVASMEVGVTYRKDYTFDIDITFAVTKNESFSSVSVPSGGKLAFTNADVGSNGFTIIPTPAIAKYKVSIEDYLADHVPEDMLTKEDLMYLSPEMYGAKGDGVANDATAVQNCINAAITAGLPVRGNGKYKIGAGIDIVASDTSIYLHNLLLSAGTYAVSMTGRNNIFYCDYLDTYSVTGACGFRLATTSTGVSCHYNEIRIGRIEANTNAIEFVNGYSANEKRMYYNKVFVNTIVARYGNCFYFSGSQMAENSFYGKKLTCTNGWGIFNTGFSGVATNRFYGFTFEEACQNGVYGVATLIDCRTAEMMNLSRSDNNIGILFCANGGSLEAARLMNGFVDYVCVDVSNATSLADSKNIVKTALENGTAKIPAFDSVFVRGDYGFVIGQARRLWNSRYHSGNSDGERIPNGHIIVYYNRKGYVPDEPVPHDITVSSYTPITTDYRVPTIFHVKANTTINLDFSYCAIGIKEIQIVQHDNYKAVVNDKYGTTIFDGTTQPSGTYKLSCVMVPYTFTIQPDGMESVTYSKMDCYGRYFEENEEWTVEKVYTVDDAEELSNKANSPIESSASKNTFSATELNAFDNYSIESDATGHSSVLVSKYEDLCPLTEAFTNSTGTIHKEANINVVTVDGSPISNASYYAKVNAHAYITPKEAISAGDTAYFSFSVDGTITGSGTTPGRGEFVFKYTDESTETIHVDFGMSGGLASGSLTAAKDVQYIYVTFLFRKDYTFDVNITWAVSKVAFSTVSVPSGGILKFSETDIGSNGFTIIPTVAAIKHKVSVEDYVENYVGNHIPEGMLVKKDLVYISPEMYGAKGDGVTDDTTALQACVNAAKLNIASDVPKIPIRGYGKYKITSGITVIGSYMDIQLNSIMFANGTYAEDSCAVKVTGRNNLIRINYINAYDAVNVGAFRLETSPNVTDNCQYNEIYLGIIYGNTNGVEYVNDYGSYTDGSGQTQMKTIYYNRLYINSNIARYGNCFYFRGTIGGCMNENSFWAKRLTSYNNYAIYNDGWTGTDSHRFYDVCIESSCANGVYGYASLINARTTECMDLKRYPDALNKGDIFTFNGITAEGGLCLGSTMIDYESVNVSNAKSFEQALASIQYRYDELNLTKAQAITPLLPGNPVLGNAFRFWDYYAVPSERQGPATLMRGKIIVYYNRKGFVPDHDWETTITVSDYTPLVTEIKIPTIFNIGANTTIHLDDSYCCIGVNKIKIIQQNDYKATVYDKDNNLIFDGTGQPDGTYCLNCELVNYSFSFVSERTGRTVTYDTDISGRFYGPNEKWTVEKLNIISAT